MRFEELRPGDVVAGKYRVRSILSETRGQLLEAFHTEFDQRVVIRVLSPKIADEKEVERFRREWQVLAKLQSEHAARIIDVGTQPDGSFYLVRQFIEGIDLATLVKENGPLPIPDAVHYVLQAAEAVAETHAHGIVLRELGTSHLMLSERLGGEREVKIIDFGTAKLLREEPGASDGEVTTTTMFGLSPYSSPELIRKDKHLDHRTDVWSLGAILYELLTGRPPFDGDLAMLLLQITKEEPPPIAKLRREVPHTLAKVVSRAMAKSVEARLQSVQQLARALLTFAPGRGSVLVDRIGKLEAARRTHAAPRGVGARAAGSRPPGAQQGAAHASAADDEVLEISQVEEVIEPAPPATDEDEPTRVGFSVVRARHADDEDTATLTKPVLKKVAPKRLAPPSRTPRSKPPRKVTQEKTEPVGRSFLPISPTPPPTHKPVFAGAAATLGDDPAQLDLQADADARPAGPASWPGAELRPSSPHAPITSSALAPGSSGEYHDHRGTTSGARKAVVGFVAASCVLLPAFLGLLFFQDAAEDPEPLVRDGTEEAAADDSTSERETALTEPDPAGEPGAQGVAVGPDPLASDPPVGDPLLGEPGVEVEIIQETTPSSTSAQGAKPSKPATAWTPPPQAAPSPKAPEPPPKPETASASHGTLVAIAVGGTCAFSVNGAPKGTTTTLKLPLKPGTYSVTCKPATGATKSRSVRIDGGGTAMAMFKL